MIVRAVDSNNDWLFGKGLNDYKVNVAAVAQDIQTRLQCFLGDCFFDQGAGINWWNLLGGKDQLSLNLAVSAVILNTAGVQNMTQLFITNDNRAVTISYEVTTIYGPTVGAQTTVNTGI